MARDTFDKASKLGISAEDLKQASYLKTELEKIANRIGNEKDTPLHTYKVKADILSTDLLKIAQNSGFLDDEAFDLIEYGVASDSVTVLTYTLDDIAQFQVVLDILGEQSFRLKKRPAEFFFIFDGLGGKLILEDEENFKIQGLVP